MYDVKWLISECGDLEIRLEFERNGLDKCYNYSEGSHKPNEDDQVIQVRGVAVWTLLFLLLSGHWQHFERTLIAQKGN